jgi:capsid protein
MTETWKFMQGRKKAVADRMAKAVYVLWLEEEINAGNVPMPKGKGAEIFYDPVMREALTACDWIGASRGQIDELKETQSAIMRIKSGLSTYEKECARLGEDYRRVFRQAAREQKLMEKLNVTFDTEATKPGANEAKKTMENKADEREKDDEL